MLIEDKGLQGIKIPVLGTNYLVRCVDATDMPSWFFDNCKGYCDHTSKVITVENLVAKKNDYNDALADIEDITNQTVRHELLHAFLRESGLGDETNFDEIIIDWFALQAPKIFQTFCRAKAFLPQEFISCKEAFYKENVKGDVNNVTTRITNRN